MTKTPEINLELLGSVAHEVNLGDEIKVRVNDRNSTEWVVFVEDETVSLPIKDFKTALFLGMQIKNQKMIIRGAREEIALLLKKNNYDLARMMKETDGFEGFSGDSGNNSEGWTVR